MHENEVQIMSTKIEVKIFDGEKWNVVWTKETNENIKPDEVEFDFENDGWKIWGRPEDLK